MFYRGLITALYALPYFWPTGWQGRGSSRGVGQRCGLYLFFSRNNRHWPPAVALLVLQNWPGRGGDHLTIRCWWRDGVLLRLDERQVGTAGKQPNFSPPLRLWDNFRIARFSWANRPFAAGADPLAGRRSASVGLFGRQPPAVGSASPAQIETVRQLAAVWVVNGRCRHGDSMGLGERPTRGALLRSLQRVSQDVAAALAQESAYNQRLALRGVEERLDGLLRELTRSSDPYAPRFRPVVGRWRELVAAAGLQLAAEAELRQELDNPYIIGVPLTEKQELFVGRTDISSRIEQLLLDRRRPPLLLYGQRRVGKTSLLNNLGRLLPRHIVPLFVDLQGPATRAGDAAGFFYNVARAMRQSARRQRQLELPELPRETLAADPFTAFDEWLDAVEAVLGSQTGLLLLDEFEVLAEAFANNRLDEAAILGTLRHLIQHHPRFKVLLSGSHTLAAFHRWSSYLINVQLVHIGFLSEAETNQLVERPVAGFALRYEPAARARVWELTSGHPFLVQLLCAEVVALKNEQPPGQRRLATVADVETAVLPALEHGSFFFADLAQNQVSEAGRAFLRQVARGEETAVANPSLLNQLVAQEILQPNGTFRVELVRRWFAL
ncbi:MAG: ATP-binding protein [Ardenticatenaceae bacterium]|nr:ATP-binding protein [Ardenticatenaceae bacterium]